MKFLDSFVGKVVFFKIMVTHANLQLSHQREGFRFLGLRLIVEAYVYLID